MTNASDRLYDLLPIVYRIRDAEQGEPLKALLAVIAEQVDALEEDLAQLYDDHFIETCAKWVAPYIGDLIGYRLLQRRSTGHRGVRAEVANTIAYRRRKGTATMLEQLARDVTGWPARVVEFFQRVTTTQFLNHVRPDDLATVGLRKWKALERLGGAFESATHTIDVRSIAKGQGRYNLRNIGILVWRLEAQSLTKATPFRVDDLRYVFSPLGNDAALFTRPEVEDDITHLAEPVNVPMPISIRVMDDERSRYYGDGKSVAVYVPQAGQPGLQLVPVTDIAICDLRDVAGAGGQWAHTPVQKVTIDPVLGRVAFPAPAPPVVGVSFHYGFSDDLGGGEYERANSFELTRSASIVQVAGDQAALQKALDQAGKSGGIVEITDNGRYEGKLGIALAPGMTVELRAENGRRPTLVLDGPLEISGDGDATLVVNGLVISGDELHVTKLHQLTLRHCSLVPGRSLTPDGQPKSPDDPSLTVESDTTSVTIKDSIVGALRVVEGAKVDIEDSIVDATAPERIAFAGLGGGAAGGGAAGGTLRLERATVIGKVHAHDLPLASESILWARLGDAPGETWKAPVVVEERQSGCVRFSWVPPGSRVPRRYRCQPDLAVAAALEASHKETPARPDADVRADVEERVVPLFTAERYGDPAYAQLDRCAPDEIRTGAEDGSEMGVFASLQQPLRERDLITRLEEYLPFGLEAGIIHVT